MLDSLPNTEHILTQSIEVDSQYSNINPTLILILLDKCTAISFDLFELEKFRQRYWRAPIISIVESKYCVCKNCLFCRKYSWHFIPANASSQDIELLIRWHSNLNSRSGNKEIEFSLKQRSLIDLFIGDSVSTTETKIKIITIAPQDVTVLIQGETGTGKELCAKLLHYLSKRSRGPFISINCGAIPSPLFENELFGHKKGAYTNADKSENGLIYAANHGTLFLDEIESLPMSSQVKLLRFLEEKKYRPLGQSNLNISDVRIIVASNCNLEDLVKSGKFRSDLFYRVSVVNLSLSPLRERTEDIPLLTQHFVEKFSKLYSKNIKGIQTNAILSLVHYAWPGNVRELENVIQEAIVLCSDSWIGNHNLNYKKLGSSDFALKTFQDAKNDTIENFEKEYLNAILNGFHGNISKASIFAGKDRRELYRLITKHKIKLNKYRSKEFSVKF